MKARPILMSAPMVRALLECRKTQTRRVVKGIALDWLDSAAFDPTFVADPTNGVCPYGQTGDLLWVREPWGILHKDGRMAGMPTFEFERYSEDQYKPRFCGSGSIVYRADGKDYEKVEGYKSAFKKQLQCAGRWRPSIHMPRWASRLTLELTVVRVERLQDISEADAVSEGATSRAKCHGFGCQDDGWAMDWSNVGTPSRFGTNGILTERDVCLGSAKMAFGSFINSLHGGERWNCRPETPIWDQNPWVWTLEFKVHQANLDTLLRARAA